MNTLIIYAHPHREGHSGYYLQRVEEEMARARRDYELVNLYDVSFNPVLKNEEHYTSSRSFVAPEIHEFQHQISEAENLMLIFPTWWQGVPAILKGFFDRVFLPGFAFNNNGKFPEGLLKGRNAVVLTSTAGPRLFSIFTGDLAIRAVRDATLKFCGYKAKAFAVGGSTELSDETKKKMDRQVVKAVKFLK